MLKAQWIQAAKAQGWRMGPSSSGLVRLVCDRQGCNGSITVPMGNLGPVPTPCDEPHHGQYSRHVYQDYQELVRDLARKRKALGLSQLEVADAAGMAEGYINKLEAFDRSAQFPTLQLWAATLGMVITLAPAPLPPATQRAIQARRGPLRPSTHKSAHHG